MSNALSGPFAVAAFVLCVAAVAKLRSPASVRRALVSLGLPAHTGLVRALAIGELVTGAASLVAPGPVSAAALAALYATFSVVAAVLHRRQSSCGCFGSDEAPASIAQSGLSASLALVGLAAIWASPRGIGWILERPVGYAAVLILGITGAVYATVLAYTELPRAWGAWSVR